jgi:hypothetical protein
LASDKSCLAKAWPMKPPAPVMRIFMLIVLVIIDVDKRYESEGLLNEGIHSH